MAFCAILKHKVGFLTVLPDIRSTTRTYSFCSPKFSALPAFDLTYFTSLPRLEILTRSHFLPPPPFYLSPYPTHHSVTILDNPQWRPQGLHHPSLPPLQSVWQTRSRSTRREYVHPFSSSCPQHTVILVFTNPAVMSLLHCCHVAVLLLSCCCRIALVGDASCDHAPLTTCISPSPLATLPHICILPSIIQSSSLNHLSFH